MRKKLWVAAGAIVTATTTVALPASADFQVTVNDRAALVVRGRVDYNAANQIHRNAQTAAIAAAQSATMNIPEMIDGKPVEIDIVYVDYYGVDWHQACR